MIQKGTFIKFKKILGWTLAVLAIGMFFDFEIILQIGQKVLAIIIGIASFFLIRSGMRL